MPPCPSLTVQQDGGRGRQLRGGRLEGLVLRADVAGALARGPHGHVARAPHGDDAGLHPRRHPQAPREEEVVIQRSICPEKMRQQLPRIHKMYVFHLQG